MEKSRIVALFVVLVIVFSKISGQISTAPLAPTINEEVTITIDINKCSNKSLLGYSGDVYVHTGLITAESGGNTDWKYVVTDWNTNSNKYKASRTASNKYTFTVEPDIRTFYGITENETVQKLALVLRSSDGNAKTEDLFVNVYNQGLTLEITSPEKDTIINLNETIKFKAKAVPVGTSLPDSICLYMGDSLVHVSKHDTIDYSLSFNQTGTYQLRVKGQTAQYSAKDSVVVYCVKEVITKEVPVGLRDGINYTNDTTVSFVLHAPGKSNVLLLGDFNQWRISDEYLLYKSADNKKWWITITGLKEGQEYAFQYLVDGELRIADPYSEKILDPENDKYISKETYPDLMAYPDGKTTGIVGVIKPGEEPYGWEVKDFKAPEVTDLVIYELHIQNFTEKGDIKTLTDTLGYLERLGVNAIELMPVNEFEGNISWGYNPSFYFALDKAYGTKQDFKKFVDACHEKGIAVIIDMVLNHSFSQSPLVQLYWDGANVTGESPWYNTTCPHSNWCWGFDFNHESEDTKYFVDRVNAYWLDEYKIDGYRFDFTKGFTNTKDANANGPDASRISILKRMANKIWEVNKGAYVIFEHLTDNSEEKTLSDHGIMLWGNMNYNYNEATMGYTSGGKSDFSGISYKSREWTKPHLVGYMESHDEERLVYKNQQYGNSDGSWYDIKSSGISIARVEAAAAFFFTVPGPKMIWEFGELGYDYSINRCEDGSVSENCRLSLKPVRWDYFEHYTRYRLFKIFELLIEFKTKHNVTKTTDFDISFRNALKTLHLNGNDMNVTVVGNFGVSQDEVIPGFQHTGTWYSYLTGESIEVTDTEEPIKLAPGEYFVFTDKEVVVEELPSSIISIEDIEKEAVRVYPNPATIDSDLRLLNVPEKTERLNIRLYNTLGQQVFAKELKGGKEDEVIELSECRLNTGVYLFKVSSDAREYSGKLIMK